MRHCDALGCANTTWHEIIDWSVSFSSSDVLSTTKTVSKSTQLRLRYCSRSMIAKSVTAVRASLAFVASFGALLDIEGSFRRSKFNQHQLDYQQRNKKRIRSTLADEGLPGLRSRVTASFRGFTVGKAQPDHSDAYGRVNAFVENIALIAVVVRHRRNHFEVLFGG